MWQVNSHGNYVLVRGGVEATVYRKDGGWGGVWNGAPDRRARVLKAKCETAQEAVELVDEAIDDGLDSDLWWPPNNTWRQKKDGKGWYCTVAGGEIVSVKQARTGSWYATLMGDAMLGRQGRTSWFSTLQDAMDAADEVCDGRGGWEWIPR